MYYGGGERRGGKQQEKATALKWAGRERVETGKRPARVQRGGAVCLCSRPRRRHAWQSVANSGRESEWRGVWHSVVCDRVAFLHTSFTALRTRTRPYKCHTTRCRCTTKPHTQRTNKSPHSSSPVFTTPPYFYRNARPALRQERGRVLFPLRLLLTQRSTASSFFFCRSACAAAALPVHSATPACCCCPHSAALPG